MPQCYYSSKHMPYRLRRDGQPLLLIVLVLFSIGLPAFNREPLPLVFGIDSAPHFFLVNARSNKIVRRIHHGDALQIDQLPKLLRLEVRQEAEIVRYRKVYLFVKKDGRWKRLVSHRFLHTQPEHQYRARAILAENKNKRSQLLFTTVSLGNKCMRLDRNDDGIISRFEYQGHLLDLRTRRASTDISRDGSATREDLELAQKCLGIT